MEHGIELQPRSGVPSWLAFPEDHDQHTAARQSRIQAFTGLCAAMAVTGSLGLMVLNLMTWRQHLKLLFQPAFPVLTPILFCLLSAGTVWHACRASQTWPGCHSADSRTRSPTRRFGWLQEFKAAGRHFHSKVVLLEVLQLINQGRRLERLVFLGQDAVWIFACSCLICLNGVVTPVLHFSRRVQNNTFLLTLFDAFMDTAFGAVLPACMVTQVAIQYLSTDYHKDYQELGDKDGHGAYMKAFLVGRGLVPTTAGQLLSLAWPHLSLWVKLVDLQSSRDLMSLSAGVDRRQRLFGPWFFGAVYLLVGVVMGLLGITARLRSPCWSKSWQEGCAVFRFDLAGHSCECAFYQKKENCASWNLLEEMLQDSRSLEALTMRFCWPHASFPDVANNTMLRYLLLSDNKLEELPSLNELRSLKELQVGKNRLKQLPDLSSNTALQLLDVEANYLTELPSFRNNPKLAFLTAEHNSLKKPPDLSQNTELVTLALDNNFLRESPDLSANHKLKDLSLSSNYLVDLPSWSQNPNLDTVFLENNFLKTLPSLRRLTKLRRLFLERNYLRKLPSFDANTRLEYLGVSHNPSLGSLPSLRAAKSLKVLDANSVGLEELPDLSADARLTMLQVSDNRLRRLNLSGPQFQSLVSLDASNNSLKEVAGMEGQSFPHLSQLWLAENLLTDMPSFSAPRLTDVDVSGNQLTELALSSFKRLRTVTAGNNQLVSISGLSRLQQLTFLVIWNNRLRSLPGLTSCRSLHMLQVGQNSLMSVEPLPANMVCFKAEQNNLTTLPDLRDNRKLKELDVAHNMLEEIPSLANCPLMSLVVRGNRLKKLPGIKHLRLLNVLDASDNQLASLPPLKRLSLLQVLCLEYNELQQLPPLPPVNVLGCSENPLREKPPTPTQSTMCDCCADRSVSFMDLAFCHFKTISVRIRSLNVLVIVTLFCILNSGSDNTHKIEKAVSLLFGYTQES